MQLFRIGAGCAGRSVSILESCLIGICPLAMLSMLHIFVSVEYDFMAPQTPDSNVDNPHCTAKFFVWIVVHDSIGGVTYA